MAKSTHHLSQFHGQVRKNSSITTLLSHLGPQMARHNVYVELQDKNATANAYGLYELSQNQHCDCQTYIDHQSPYSYSEELYKGVLKDNSHGVFRGRIKIAQDAQKVEANQLNKNLILSKKARANSMPQLEIFADDVKCSHGSTTGQISEDEIFYLQSRGITAQKAYQLLVESFTKEILLKIPPHLRKKHYNPFRKVLEP